MFTSSPLYPPYLTPRAPAQVDQPRPEHLRGLAGREREPRLPEAGLPQGARRASCSRSRWSTDTQDLPFTGKALECYELWLPGTTVLPEPAAVPRGREPLPLQRAQSRGRAGRGSEGRAVRIAGTRRLRSTTPSNDELDPGFLGFADDNWVDGTQSFVFNFVSPADRRRGLRADDHPDPRVRPSLRDEPPARRVRLGDRHRLRADRDRSSSPGPPTSRTRS